jgi:hypothetical protein
MQHPTGDEFLGNLTFERDAMGTMSAMASILQKPDAGGQNYKLKLSTRRDALQLEG